MHECKPSNRAMHYSPRCSANEPERVHFRTLGG
jgi:hypothetical protein